MRVQLTSGDKRFGVLKEEEFLSVLPAVDRWASAFRHKEDMVVGEKEAQERRFDGVSWRGSGC